MSDSQSETRPADPNATDPGSTKPSPTYAFPTSFSIGRQSVNAVVSPEQLKGHLALLRIFYALRTTVEDAQDERFPAWARNITPEQRWSWFISLAVER